MQDNQLLALYELATVFAGKNDVRKYLNQVLIRNVGEDCHIVAADGHKLIKITIANYQTILPERIDVKSIKDAVKVKNLSLIREGENFGTYPDYERLIPKECKAHDLPKINTLFLAQAFAAVNKASKAFDFNMFGITFENITAENGNVFGGEFNANTSFKIVVMPMRK